MKNTYTHIIRTASFLLLALLLPSCNNFLNENPKTRTGDESIKTEKDLFLHTVATLYNHIGGNRDSYGLQGTGRGVYDLNTLTTDEAIMPIRGVDWYDGGFWEGLFLHKWGVNNDAILATWEYLYKVVLLCNSSLEKIENFTLNHPKTNYIEALQAEVRAIRAMYYYYLMDLFAQVPLIETEFVSSKNLQQSSRRELFDFIVKELQETAPLLSTNRSNQPGEFYGRITRPVVFFLLAKIALNAEVYTDNDWTDGVRPKGEDISFKLNNETFNAWETVEAYCDSISALGYLLEKNYSSNFSIFNESSNENIFTIPMNKILYSNQSIYLFRSRHYNHGAAYGLGGENGTSATLEALQCFGYGTSDIDPRFEDNYYAGIVSDLEGNVIKTSENIALEYFPQEIRLNLSGTKYEKTAGARMKKYEIDKYALKDGRLFDNDIVLFRYADVLLMKCEAKVRNGENGDAELKEIRDRVGASARTATLENILNERQLELAWEGWRRQDLIRFKKFTQSYPLSERPQLANEESGFTTVFPIPDKLIKINASLKQNPGY